MDWKILSIICMIQIGLYVFFRRKNKVKKVKNSDTSKGSNIELYRFTPKSSMCTACLGKLECNSYTCSFFAERRLISLLENAQSSINICMYMFTSKNLGEAVLKAFNKGVKVRVISDAESSFTVGTQIQSFRDQAIPVRIKRTDTLMHHKFAIVDEKLLITGSSNWTAQSFLGNWDHILITSEPILVKKFACEFDELFEQFSQAHKQ